MAHFPHEVRKIQQIDCDFSSLEGTCCYCSTESANGIREAISTLPANAVHLLGTGDYHYISLFWLERLKEPFALVLFDNHPDDQPTAFGGDLLSCGSWVAEARSLPLCKADFWLRSGGAAPSIPDGLPVYLSIDLDVLSPEFARTDWDQGAMTLDELCEAISGIISSRRILGVDICGGITQAQGGTPEDAALNSRTMDRILNTLPQSLSRA